MRFAPLIMLLACAVLTVAAYADTIITDNGAYVDAPKGYRAVFVPKGTGRVLVEVKGVEVVYPKGKPAAKPAEPDCVKPGSLVLGPGTPCPE